MKVVIDVDSHQAIQDFGIRSPAGTYQFKSQDTVEWEIYFAQGGIVQDMGSGFAIKFGMIKTGDTTNTLLAYQTVFNYLIDANGNPYYSGLVNFNTSQMATAIGTSPSIPGTAEIRYQDALNEIIHTINISTMVYATIIVETGVTPPNVSTGYPDASTIELLVHKNAASGYAGLDSTTHLNGSVVPVDGQTIQIASGKVASAAILAYTAANFTTPAINSSVSVTFVSTSGLVQNSYVRIPIAGFYVVNSITDSTHAILQNNGDPFNAAAGVTITSGAVILPAQAAAGGGTTGQAAYTTLTAGFTVPAVGSTVSINVASTVWMGGSGYAIFITGAGYYLVNSVTDATHAVVTNSGSPANQPAGTSVPSGGTVSVSGPQGGTGAAGASLSAYTSTTASFTMPSVGATVSVTVGNTGWVSAGQIIYVAGAGYLQVATVVNATTLSCNNLNYPGNSTAGTVVASGANVTPGGLQGPAGAGGPGLNAFTTLSANYTQPAVGSTVIINVGTTAWMAVGQGVFVQGGGYYTVSSISDLAHAVVNNLGGPSNPAMGTTITAGTTPAPIVAPAGIPGTSGINAYTITTANFTTPAAGSSATVAVATTGWAANGQNIFIAGAGYYQIASIISASQLSVTNLGANYGNAAGGTTINSGAQVTPAGVIGPAGPPGSQGASGRDGAYSTVYAINSIQGNGGVASNLQLVGDVAQGSGAYKVYQRDSSGNSKWDVALLSATDAVSAPGAGEVSHVQAQTSGVLSIKKLKSGPAGSVALTDQGGSTGDILIDVPVDGTTVTVVGGKLTASGGGAGVDMQDPENGIEWRDHFIPPQTFSLTNPVMGLSWSTINPGGANFQALPTGLSLLGTGPEMSAIAIGSNPAANGYIDLTLGSSGTTNNWCVPIGLGICTYKSKVAIDSLVTSVDALTDQIGIFRYSFSGGMLGGFFFEYNYAQSANWRCCVRTGSGTTNVTYVDSGVVVAANTWYKFKVVSNAAWTSFAFYINNTLVATITTNVPTAGTDIGLAPHFLQVRTAYTANKFIYCGYFYLNYPFTN